MNKILFLGALLGFLSLSIAASIDHHAALFLNSTDLNSVLTAVRYQQFYALVVSVLGLLFYFRMNNKIEKALKLTAYLFLIGMILFSFSIYIALLVKIHFIIYLTPVGGIVLMLGWLSLMRIAFVKPIA